MLRGRCLVFVLWVRLVFGGGSSLFSLTLDLFCVDDLCTRTNTAGWSHDDRAMACCQGLRLSLWLRSVLTGASSLQLLLYCLRESYGRLWATIVYTRTRFVDLDLVPVV